MPDLRAAARWCLTASAVTVLVGAFLPWLHSGARARSSFAAFRLIERLGFAPNGLIGVGLRLWPVAPLLVVASVVLAWWGWAGRAAAVGLAGGAYVLAVGVAVAQAPRRANVFIGGGPVVAAVGAAGLILGALLTLAAAAQAERHSPRRASTSRSTVG